MLFFLFPRWTGGEGGIRTLDRGLPYTPLAGERFQPLSHLSGIVYSKVYDCLMESAAFSAIIIVGALVLPPIKVGMIEASTTRKP